MRILISTFGTQGDIQPFIALGKCLQANGHVVALCTASGYQSLVEQHGLQYAFMHNTMLELTSTLLARQGNTFASIRQLFLRSSFVDGS